MHRKCQIIKPLHNHNMKIKFYSFFLLSAISFLNAQKSPIEINTMEKVITMNQSLYFNTEDQPFLGTVTKIDNSKQQLLLYGYAPKETASYDSFFTTEYAKMGNDLFVIKLNRTRDKAFII